jgi:hypothetical protein
MRQGPPKENLFLDAMKIVSYVYHDFEKKKSNDCRLR